jgi:hypothetical protein
MVVASVVVVLGVAAAVTPDLVIATGRRLVSPSGLHAAAAFRAGMGLVLILAARASRAPGLLRAIGAVVLVGGLIVSALRPGLIRQGVAAEPRG